MDAFATIYFHGLPGSVAELGLFGPLPGGKAWHFPDRAAAARAPDPFGAMADGLVARFPDARFDLAGFSLGGAAALRVAARLGERVQSVVGIAAAAPLQLGDFLPGMAGAPVFRAAMVPWRFALLARVHGAMARVAPGAMRSMLFAAARGEDRTLAADPQFCARIENILRQSLADDPRAYRREVPLYVADWSEDLDRVRCPVTLWQGEADDWVPPAMADALAARLPGGAQIRRLPGLSHYSTLRHYLRGG
ncbi:MAG: alpha/beta hydrolase [Erythrobacter sp.]|jgi:pimeloyl-ACP methyl ester carboxylesterase